ncbi:MAG TPA: hypothetical protein VJ783_08900 [Pirellulales bacterium]|nr:hypothetical protein [Pirellulales bacterium]
MLALIIAFPEWNNMSEISFPTKPFYIQSKINMSNWALTVKGDQIKTKPIQGNVNFLWTARKDPRGGSVLANIGSELVLTAQVAIVPVPWGRISVPTGPLLAKTFDSASSLQLFRAEAMDGPWRCMNALLDWEMKVNVYGSDLNGTIALFQWDGGADNEEWLFIEETAQVETVSVDYHTDLIKIDLSRPPTFGEYSLLDNRQGGTPLTGSTSVTSTATDSRQITNSVSNTTGRKYVQTFGMKGGIDKVFEVNASGSFEESSSETISYTDQTIHTVTETITKTVNYNVPAGKKYKYQLLINSGRCEVPYTAHMKFQSALPGSDSVLFDSRACLRA